MSRFVHLIELADAMLKGDWSIELVQNVKKIPRGSLVKLLNAIRAIVELRFLPLIDMVERILEEPLRYTASTSTKSQAEDLYGGLQLAFESAQHWAKRLSIIMRPALQSAEVAWHEAGQEAEFHQLRFHTSSLPYHQQFRGLSSAHPHEHFFEIFTTFLAHKTERAAGLKEADLFTATQTMVFGTFSTSSEPDSSFPVCGGTYTDRDAMIETIARMSSSNEDRVAGDAQAQRPRELRQFADDNLFSSCLARPRQQCFLLLNARKPWHTTFALIRFLCSLPLYLPILSTHAQHRRRGGKAGARV
ncbi:hypothetical protein LTS18_000346 [Coniosporium uncinatum]|uniref:Uncharacterized protein n=1 Tax=Coniosporium uncinatum TaxID=93489 RepID=A0ACC3DV42_9PEZI|nr:hypothetical protein LTS18_000346 [Coniosporium uncinatum]